MKWFKHDTNANRDAKLQRILMRYGADGYAIYWYCIELIAGNIDKNNITFELEHDSELIGNTLQVDTLRVEEIMKTMVEIGLFDINPDNNRVMCLKLANRLDDTTSKNPEIRHIIAKAKEYGKIKSTNQYVYVFQDNDKYKIGKTINVERRFNDAKTLNTNVSLYHFIKTVDSYLMENKLHNYFNSKRIEGEWFSLNKNDLEFICSVKSIEDIPDISVLIPNGSEQNRLDKNRLDKNRLDKNKIEKKEKEIHYENDLFIVTLKQHNTYKEVYNSIDVDEQYKLIYAWLISNPKKRYKDYSRFINNWLKTNYERQKEETKKTVQYEKL